MARKDADKGAKARKAENMAAALEYKKAGSSERLIAERLGISKTTVHRYISEGLAEIRAKGLQSAEDMVTLEAERLDQARFAIAAKVVRGELGAIDRWIRISERYCKLYGLDKPTALALTNPEGNEPWQFFDPKVLAEHLTPEQLEALEEVLTILERIGASGEATGGKAVGESDSEADDE